MPAESMIERVSSAVLADLTDRSGFSQAWDDCDDDVRAEIRAAIGRAAIAAMRDPSDGMCDAIANSIDARTETTEQTWHAAIDTALKEGE